MGSSDNSSSRSHSRKRSKSRSIRHIRRRYSISPLRNSYGTRLHVGDIDGRLTKKDIVKAFQKFGPLIEVWIAKSSPCFGFVVFECKEDADEALEAMNGHTLGNNRLRVTYALPRVYERSRRPSHIRSRCYQCGERGHFLRDCRNFRNRFRPRSPPRRRYYRSRSRSRRRSSSRDQSLDDVRSRCKPKSRDTSSRSSLANVKRREDKTADDDVK